jgi:hypothetical protein
LSHHLAGLTAKNDPRLNITDFYLFKGEDGPVFVMNTNGLDAASGWHPEARYEIHIDTDGDHVPDVTFTVVFDGDRHGLGQGTSLYLQVGHGGDRDERAQCIAHASVDHAVTLSGGLRFYAGRRSDPFFIPETAVTAVRQALTTGTALDLGDFDPLASTNLFGGTTVHSIAIEIEEQVFGALTGCPDSITAWAAVSVPNENKPGHRQVDRSGAPLAATLFGFDQGDAFNAGEPADDEAEWGAQIRAMIAACALANGFEGDAEAYAAEAAKTFVPNVLPYRVGTEADFAKRNGRNLTGNTPEHLFALVLGGKPVDTGLGPQDATGALRRSFPYLAAAGLSG